MNVPGGPVERWPPIYDANDLREEIRQLAASGELFTSFYSDLPNDGSWCQGDIVELKGDFPHIDEEGRAATLEDLDVENWLVLSNSCDLYRPLEDVRWAQLVPLLDVPATPLELAGLRSYTYSR